MLHLLSCLHLDLALFTVVALAVLMIVVQQCARLGVEPALRIGLALGIAAVTAIASIAALRADRAERIRMQAMLSGIAPASAWALARSGYEHLVRDQHLDAPACREVVAQQRALLRMNPHVRDVYTLHRTADGAIARMIDSASGDDRDGRVAGQRSAVVAAWQAPLQARDLAERAFAGEPAFGAGSDRDRSKAWVMAFAPVRADDGSVSAVLAVEHDADAWHHAIATARLALLSLFGLVIGLAGGGVVLWRSHHEAASRRLLAAHNRALAAANEEQRHAVDRAEVASEAKTTFLANMSHELRTPLTSILGFADVLLEPDLDDDTRRECVATIRRSGQHLLRILSDVLDLAHAEAGELELQVEPCDPARICQDVAELMAGPARDKGLAFATDIAASVPDRIMTDPQRLRQVLLHLVGNAVKFTERGAVRLEVSCDGTELHFVVVDTGCGIPAVEQERLFDAFRQGDGSPTRRHGGAGLGLAMSQRFAALLGGELQMTRSSSDGSTFAFRMPYRPVPTPAAAPAPDAPPAAGAGAARILLVEDGRDNQRLLTHVLRRAGHQVEVVDNGRIACDRLLGAGGQPAGFDLVLMDMQMPEMDGYEATRKLRAAGLDLPIVALTAHAAVFDRERCLAAGCDDYLTKPIDRPRLLAALQSWTASPNRDARANNQSGVASG